MFLLFKLSVLNDPLPVSTTVKAESAQSEGRVSESKPPRHVFLLGWVRNGFNLQPESDYYVKFGESLMIQTNFVSSNRFEGSRKWWIKTNNDHGKWTPVENNNSGDITIDTQKYKGVSKIQCQLVVTDSSGKKSVEKAYGSKVAHIHVTNIEKPATDIKIKLNSDYIYSIKENMLFDSSTYASAMIEPFDTTNKVHWTLGEYNSDTNVPILENKLATVNNSGLVTAQENAEGEVSVTGYIINEDGTSVSDTKKLRIGGGLEDRTSHVGQRATFHIETGGSDQKDDELKAATIKWYRVVNGKTKEIFGNKDNHLELTTPVLTEADDGNQYYATIGNQNKKVETRHAKLTVLQATDSKIHVTTKLKNLDYEDKNNSDKTILKKVAPGDRIEYTFTLQNGSSKDLKESSLKIYLNQFTKCKEVKVENKNVDKFSLDNSDKKKQSLEIPIGQLKRGQELKVTVLTEISDVSEENFSFKPILVGKYDDDKGNGYKSEGNTVTLEYTSNNIRAIIHPIRFKPISLFERNNLKRRTIETNDPNAIVEVKDTRRKRVPVRVTVKQLGNFTNDHSDILDANLLFFSSQVTPLTIGKAISVAYSDEGKALESIKWKDDAGLLLKIGNIFPKLGNYQADVEWSIENVPT